MNSTPSTPATPANTPQPPPPPGKRLARLLLRTLLSVLLLLLVLFGISFCTFCVIVGPVPDGSRISRAQREEVCHNLKELHGHLERFRAVYGSYPCDATADLLAARHPEHPYGELKGDHANAYLSQLFFLENPPGAQLFYTNINCAGRHLLWGDVHVRQAQQLGQNVNAMAYVLRNGLHHCREAVQPLGQEPMPLLICSVYPTKAPIPADKLTVDNCSLRGHAFVLYTDGSVRDLFDVCEEDWQNDELASPTQSPFPNFPDGSSSAPYHIVLPPLLASPEGEN